MLSPADIDKKQFTATRFKEGYDQEEVDAFLDQASAALKETQARLAAAQDRLTVLERQAKSEAPTQVFTAVPATPSAEGLLRMAQETADKHVADAKAKAEQKVAEAQAKADDVVRQAGGKAARTVAEADEAAKKMVDEATAKAERIINDGYAEQRQKLDALSAQRDQMTVAVTGLTQQGDQIRNAIQQALQAYDRTAPKQP